jgi:hypothetical protein
VAPQAGLVRLPELMATIVKTERRFPPREIAIRVLEMKRVVRGFQRLVSREKRIESGGATRHGGTNYQMKPRTNPRDLASMRSGGIVAQRIFEMVETFWI